MGPDGSRSIVTAASSFVSSVRTVATSARRVNLFSKKIARQFETKPKTKTATKTKTKRVKTPTGRALRAPLAGSPAFVFVFVAVFVFGFVSN